MPMQIVLGVEAVYYGIVQVEEELQALPSLMLHRQKVLGQTERISASPRH